VRSGSVVTPYYDSLLAKVIAYGPDRAVAAQRLSAALGELTILGIKSSQAFLRDIVDHPTFRAGHLTTRFIGETFPEGWNAQSDDENDFAAAAALWALGRESRRAAPGLGPWASLGGFRISANLGHTGWVALEIASESRHAALEISGKDRRYAIRRDGQVIALAITAERGRARVTIGPVAREYGFVSAGEIVSLGRDGRAGSFRVAPRIESAGGQDSAEAGGAGRIAAPMPGLISQLNVAPGQAVTQGDTVVVLEAMKLMYSLPAQISGRVTQVFCAPGDTVPAGTLLIEIESEPQ
jgi:3-methylcrotonyl-CoA carboxylase alpha subunit